MVDAERKERGYRRVEVGPSRYIKAAPGDERDVTPVRAFRRRCAFNRKLDFVSRKRLVFCIFLLDDLSLSLSLRCIVFVVRTDPRDVVRFPSHRAAACTRKPPRQEVDNSQLANTNRTTSGFKLPGTRRRQPGLSPGSERAVWGVGLEASRMRND